MCAVLEQLPPSCGIARLPFGHRGVLDSGDVDAVDDVFATAGHVFHWV
jgi:hypothetical protein